MELATSAAGAGDAGVTDVEALTVAATAVFPLPESAMVSPG